MNKICKFFINGKCKDGDNCKYLHENNICKYLFLKGKCKKGDKCKFKHEINGVKITSLKKRKAKNTVNFDPSHTPADMRVVYATPGLTKYNKDYLTRDVVLVPDLYCHPDDLTIYNSLLEEIKHSGVEESKLWKSWHGDSHLIADDKMDWKQYCPTFNMIIEKIKIYFNMDIKATRFNWYRDSSEWKPYHHDAAAVKPHIAKKQNFTVGISFGSEREIAFENADTKSVVSFPLPNGNVFAFGKDVNIKWRHGIPQIPPERSHNNGRISIIAWGYINQLED